MFGKRNENLINRMLFRDSMKTKMEEIGRSGSNEINQRFRKCIQSVSKSIPSEDDLITMFKQENLILSIKKKGYTRVPRYSDEQDPNGYWLCEGDSCFKYCRKPFSLLADQNGEIQSFAQCNFDQETKTYR